ncbi:hypothetical protein [Siminovitchia fortis]|uniref:hypothetical protein n=1 Tax=Siminovitchia fortis TaxID=254758 RepID=UPI00119DB937|nr:hypothetical protein [Siminovitchia fortis]
MENKQLFKEAAKYKKWLENITLNPFECKINGRSYYFAIYHGKDPNKLKGYAIISLDGGPNKEYREALYPLTLFSGASTNIFNIMGARSKIKPDYFKTVIQAIDDSGSISDGILQKGKTLFEKMIELQIPFIDLYKEYEHYYDNTILVKKVIDEKDIDHTLTVLGKLDILQFKQGLLLTEYDPIMPEFFKRLGELKNKFPGDSWNFIKGMRDNRKVLGKRMAEFKMDREIIHLPEEQQIEAKKEYTRRSAEKLIKDREKLLRGPAAL